MKFLCTEMTKQSRFNFSNKIRSAIYRDKTKIIGIQSKVFKDRQASLFSKVFHRDRCAPHPRVFMKSVPGVKQTCPSLFYFQARSWKQMSPIFFLFFFQRTFLEFRHTCHFFPKNVTGDRRPPFSESVQRNAKRHFSKTS